MASISGLAQRHVEYYYHVSESKNRGKTGLFSQVKILIVSLLGAVSIVRGSQSRVL